MTSETDRLKIFAEIVERNGREPLEKATLEILNSRYNGGAVSSAAKYHAMFLRRVTPISQALISLSCEAAGGKKGKATNIAAAISLLIEASNVHDDIIDQTAIKYSRKTVFGKFGADIALLVGDVLLAKGTMLLCQESEKLPEERKNAILETPFQTLVKVSKSVALETKMRKNLSVTPQDYLEVIKLKASAPEAHCKIGGNLGNGSDKVIQALGYYGRTYGFVGTVVDEFMDFLNYDKLRGRLENECLPLPILYALENSGIGKEIEPLIKDLGLIKKHKNKIVGIVLRSDEVQRLRKDIILLAEEEVEQMKKNKLNKATSDLIKLLEIVKEFLHSG